MLENTVMEIKTLNAVKDIQNHDKARGKKPHTYNAYLNLLLASATTLDASRGLNDTRNKISTNMSHVEYNSNQTITEESHIHDIDSYLINEVNLQENKPTTFNQKKQ